MIVIKINPAKIKDVIGPGGKMINKIIQETGAEKIDIEDDGTVYITSLDGASGDKAKAAVEAITQDVEVGKIYKGTVVRIIPIGAFVQILPGKDGLVHISQLAATRVGAVEDVVNIGDELDVKVMEVDEKGRLNLSHKATLPGATDDDDRPRRGGGGGGYGGGGGDRGPRGPRPPRDFDGPRPPRDAEASPAPGAPGAPPMRRRRRPPSHHDD
jgi:polyribonucleotide nucleotidyltransferase